MGYDSPEIALFAAPVTFCLPKKGTLHNASAHKPARPWLGKEASALFFWLVLRTAPYSLIIIGLTLGS